LKKEKAKFPNHINIDAGMATTNKRTGVNDEEDMNPNEELELSFLLLAIVFPDFDSDLKTHTSKTKINPRS